MKYEYGVEYETNGEEPDLSGDVLVQVKIKGAWQKDFGGGAYSSEVVKVRNWRKVQSFKITDERYKPASDTNVGSNWHERGELPPVGEVVEGYVQDSARQWKWLEVEILKHNNISDNECAVHVIKHAILRWCDQFRPLRTERDVLVEKAMSSLEGNFETGSYQRKIAGELIDAGWRPVKQQSEEEFGYTLATICRDITVSDAIEAYRAGCRFVEQGE